MSDVNTLLSERLNRREKSAKVTALAQKSASGDLSGFSGVFALSQLSEGETASLEDLLLSYATPDVDVASDLKVLMSLTAEVKGINNQAALLHGERIKRAHELLISYRDGAFTAWLTATYGNRQTPYNLWQYYEFYQATPKDLRVQLETMPRQAVYTLASREGRLEAKQRLVRNYAGETKQQLLSLIRETFPLSDEDRRGRNGGDTAIKLLERAITALNNNPRRLSAAQRRQLQLLVDDLSGFLAD